MQIELTTVNLRAMATRMRKAVGADVLSKSKSLETLAVTLGYKNWDTLCGMAKAAEALSAPLSFEPFSLYMSAYVCDEWGEGPDWAVITITPEFIVELQQFQELVANKGYGDMSMQGWAPNWDSDDTYRVGTESMSVTSTEFYFEGYPKHVSYQVRTASVPIAGLLAAIAEGDSGDIRLRRIGDKVFFGRVSAIDLIELLSDAGEIALTTEEWDSLS